MLGGLASMFIIYYAAPQPPGVVWFVVCWYWASFIVAVRDAFKPKERRP